MSFRKLWIALTAMLATSTMSQAQGPDYLTLSETVDDVYDCQLIKPMMGQSAESSTRVGAILSGIRVDRVDTKIVAHRIASPEEYCTPTFPIPEPVNAAGPTSWSYVKGASVAIKAEFGSVFTLGAISANYVKAFDFKILEPKVYQIAADKRRQAGREIKLRQDCAPALKTTPAKANYINYPVMITHTCVGKLDIGFVFDRGIDASAIAIQIGQLKIGLSAQLRETLGNEVPCEGGAAPADKKAADNSANAAAIAALKAIFDFGVKAATEAQAKAKALADEANKAKDENEKKDKAKAADEAQKKAEELKKKADAANEEVKKAAKTALKFAGKCYDSARLVSDQPVVFGIQYKRADTYIPK